MTPIEFKTGAVRPVECLKEGWELIKDQYWLFLGVTFVGVLIASVIPFGILIGPMFCGIYLCLFQKIYGQPMKFESLFKGFDFFKQAFIASLFIIVPMFIVIVAMYVPLFMVQFEFIQNRHPSPDEVVTYLKTYFTILTIGMLALWLVLGTVHALVFFAFPLITEHKLSGVEAIKLSARAALKNLGGIVGLIGVQAVLIIIGYFALCVGFYFAMPLVFASSFIAYRKIFPAGEINNFNAPPAPDQFYDAGRAM